jgi:hypothetical protein
MATAASSTVIAPRAIMINVPLADLLIGFFLQALC